MIVGLRLCKIIIVYICNPAAIKITKAATERPLRYLNTLFSCDEIITFLSCLNYEIKSQHLIHIDTCYGR